MPLSKYAYRVQADSTLRLDNSLWGKNGSLIELWILSCKAQWSRGLIRALVVFWVQIPGALNSFPFTVQLYEWVVLGLHIELKMMFQIGKDKFI